MNSQSVQAQVLGVGLNWTPRGSLMTLWVLKAITGLVELVMEIAS